MCTVTKKDLIDRICQQTRVRRTCVKTSIQLFLDLIVEELGKGNRLEFRDFGVFELKTRAARTAQNPKTLEPVRVPAKRTVKFKVGRLMKDKLRTDDDHAEIASEAEPAVAAPAAAPRESIAAVGPATKRVKVTTTLAAAALAGGLAATA